MMWKNYIQSYCCINEYCILNISVVQIHINQHFQRNWEDLHHLRTCFSAVEVELQQWKSRMPQCYFQYSTNNPIFLTVTGNYINWKKKKKLHEEKYWINNWLKSKLCRFTLFCCWNHFLLTFPNLHQAWV